jgi:hypothetical protein
LVTKRRLNGEGHISVKGYIVMCVKGVNKGEHIRIAEKILGKLLPTGSIVHHYNEKRGDNRPCNLVVCQDAAYHKLLHRRMRAVKAGYPKDYRWCYLCKSFDSPENLCENEGSMRHKKCHAIHEKDRRGKCSSQALQQ